MSNQIKYNFFARTWEDGFTGTLKIKNKGDLVDSWQVVFESEFAINQYDGEYEILGGDIVSGEQLADGRYRYVVEPLPYNTVLDSKESIFITFNSTWLEEEIPEISNIIFNFPEEPVAPPVNPPVDPPVDPPSESELDFNIEINPWSSNSGATVLLDAINSGDDEISDVEIKFKSDFQIRNLPTDIWNAQIVSETPVDGGYEYVLNFAGNQDLDPGESHSFGFNTEDHTPEFEYIGLNDGSEPPAPPVTPPATPPVTPPGNGTVTRPDYNKSEGFFTLNGKIYDANGNEFIPRGINSMNVWWDTSSAQLATDSLDNIAGFGFNSVRIAWDTDYSGHGDFPHDWLLENAIETTIANKMVPMVELHDFTGSSDTNDLLNRGVSWWIDRAAMWEKYEESLMINIANEFGDYAIAQGSSRAEFPRVYKEAITRMRNAGIDNTLVIDSFYWAKDYSLIAEYGREIYDSDPQKNVIFSIHFYGGAGENQGQIHEAFDSITGQGVPMIVGEFGTRGNGSTHNIQEEYIMAQAEEYGVGTYPWAWHGDLHAIGSHWEASSANELTAFGQHVVFGENGVEQTSELATIFTDI